MQTYGNCIGRDNLCSKIKHPLSYYKVKKISAAENAAAESAAYAAVENATGAAAENNTENNNANNAAENGGKQPEVNE
jgi:DNA primase large subunit